MRTTIRTRYVAWLSILILIFVAIQMLAFVGYEIHEWRVEDHFELDEELRELALLMSIDLLILPVVVLIIWGLSKRMLRPLTTIARTAERIRGGHFEERIQVPDSQDELGLVARSLNQAFDRYQDAVERLRRFSADAAHQLRTPLTAMRSLGEVSLQRPRSAEEHRETLADMLEEVQRLSQVTERLLLLARLELPEWKNHFMPVDLAEIAQRVCSQYEPFCQDKAQSFSFHGMGPARVRGDTALLEQVVANLLDNAVKFTPSGGTIRVEVEESGGREPALRVKDTGPGIDPADHQRIFERFARTAHHATTGSGLGLAIVAEIVRLHDGRVAVESEPGKGALFEILFPAAS